MHDIRDVTTAAIRQLITGSHREQKRVRIFTGIMIPEVMKIQNGVFIRAGIKARYQRLYNGRL